MEYTFLRDSVPATAHTTALLSLHLFGVRERGVNRLCLFPCAHFLFPHPPTCLQCPERQEVGDRDANVAEQQRHVDHGPGREHTARVRVEKTAAEVQGRV